MTDWSVYGKKHYKFGWNYQWTPFSTSRRTSCQARAYPRRGPETLRARALPSRHDGPRRCRCRGSQRYVISLLSVEGRPLSRRSERRPRHRVSQLYGKRRSEVAGGRADAPFDRGDGRVLRSTARFSSVLRNGGTAAVRGAYSHYRRFARARLQFFRIAN